MVDRDEFMRVVNSSPTLAEAGRRLGITFQSVKTRLDRIRLRGANKPMPKTSEMSNQQLEAAWNNALDAGDVALTDSLFDVMCRRLEKSS